MTELGNKAMLQFNASPSNLVPAIREKCQNFFNEFLVGSIAQQPQDSVGSCQDALVDAL